MASYHCSIKPISRSAGRSATAAAAYRAGARIEDERTGEVHDYTRKGGVVHSQVLLPEGVKMERSELWNQAEAAEKRKDARVAREYELALPAEVTPEEQKKLALQFARGLVKWFGVAADVSIHAPSKHGDQRNYHAHILTTTRQVTAQGMGDKADIERKDDDLRKMGKDAGSVQIEQLRGVWASICNKALERAGHAERVSSKSLQAQGIDRPATSHLGPAVTAMERRGIETDHGQRNRAIVSTMAALEATRAEPEPSRPEMPQEAPERGQKSSQVDPPRATPTPEPKKPPEPPKAPERPARERSRSRGDDRER